MSHFSVLVIGDEVERQLAPFHEFECTGIDDEFVQDVDITEECRKEGLSYCGFEDRTVADEADVKRAGKHKYGFAVVNAAGDVIKAIERTNPNKKWDWWVIGGRWSGYLKLKPGATGKAGDPSLLCATHCKPGYADTTTKGGVDFAGMRDAAALKATEKWDRAAAAHGGATWLSWEQVRTSVHPDNIEAARSFYNDQPPVAAIRAAFQDSFFVQADQYLVPRETFIAAARNSAVSTYAVVKDGQWFAKGEMGWWGISSDTATQDVWDQKVTELLDGLPDETVLTVVDCHI